jgi:ATP-dependent DNA helicase RecQ
MSETTMNEVDRAARSALHIDLTDVQREAVESVCAGRDTLLVSPTGSGKSAVYQLAGSLLEGVTVVVSPLIALQEDQAASFDTLDVGPAVAINSFHGRRHRAGALQRLVSGEAQFVLLGPEQLRSSDVLDALGTIAIDRFVVDEAHCIDSWGPDFRPDFMGLGAVRGALGSPPVLALTATAAPHVRDEIEDVLGMNDPREIVVDVERHNIDLSVVRHPDRAAAVGALRADVAATQGTGLVYVATRREAVELAGLLATEARPALAYHGSLATKARSDAHARFRSGDPVVVVATSAFGLGVDAPHVRFVHHLDAPETIDTYYQEVGRAARDGRPAVARLHTVIGKSSARQFSAGSSVPTLELCAEIAAIGVATSFDELQRCTGQPRGRLMQAVTRLRSLGVTNVSAGMTITSDVTAFDAVRDELARQLEARSILLATRRQMMSSFIEANACRWSIVCGYLGSGDVATCAHCDVCEERHEGRTTQENERIEHVQFGAGTVVSSDGDVVVALFDDHGYRTLSRAVLEEQGLLA